MVPDLGLPTIIMGFFILELNAPGKNILSIILPMPTIILNIKMSKAVITGEYQVPKVVPSVK